MFQRTAAAQTSRSLPIRQHFQGMRIKHWTRRQNSTKSQRKEATKHPLIGGEMATYLTQDEVALMGRSDIRGGTSDLHPLSMG